MLILAREGAVARLHDVLVVPATRTIRGIESEVEVDESDGMPAACVLSLDHAFLAEKAYLTERITELGAAKMDGVCRALATAAGCS